MLQGVRCQAAQWANDCRCLGVSQKDIEDRKARQKEADRHRRSVQRWLIVLALGMFAGLVLTIYLITQ